MRQAKAKRFFVSCSHLLGLWLHRSGFFNFDLCPEILPDIKILYLHVIVLTQIRFWGLIEQKRFQMLFELVSTVILLFYSVSMIFQLIVI